MSLTEQDSIASLRFVTLHHEGVQASLDMMIATSHQQRKAAVERALNAFVSQCVKYRQHKQNKSEDELTCECVDALCNMGFLAEHDTQYGGHCDIVVKGNANFVWLGEAKIHRSYDWLKKGLQQLLTRYASGISAHSYGGIVIYCFGKNAQEVLENWRNRVGEELSIIRSEPGDEPLFFRSWHQHEGSGLEFEVKHQILPLFHMPKDK